METVTYKNQHFWVVGALEYQKRQFLCLALPEYAHKIQAWWRNQTWPKYLVFQPITGIGEEILEHGRLIGLVGWERQKVSINATDLEQEYQQKLCQLLQNT